MARARADGSDAVWRGSIPTGSGMWRPTPPMAVEGFAPPVEPMAGSWRPWSLTSGDQFRPAPPPEPEGPEFRAAMREVYDVPSFVSGHATVSGAAAEILAYFFPKDAGWLRDWAKTAATAASWR